MSKWVNFEMNLLRVRSFVSQYHCLSQYHRFWLKLWYWINQRYWIANDHWSRTKLLYFPQVSRSSLVTNFVTFIEDWLLKVPGHYISPAYCWALQYLFFFSLFLNVWPTVHYIRCTIIGQLTTNDDTDLLIRKPNQYECGRVAGWLLIRKL